MPARGSARRLAGAAAFGALALLVSRIGGENRFVRADRAWPLLTAAVVGTSRVYLGVHWPADVLAGWLFAEGWLRLIDSGRREVT